MAPQRARPGLLPLGLIALVLTITTTARAAASSSIAFTPPTTTLSTASTSPSATIDPGAATWGYMGCYNETTLVNGTNGARALAGTTEALDNMTVPTCLDYCSSGGFTLAGLEYTRECYCSHYLSVFATKLPDETCNLPCEGNNSEICGGSLKLTVYQLKATNKGAGVKARESPLSSILALGIAMGVLLCLA